MQRVRRFRLGMVAVVVLTLVSCQPAWKGQLSDDLAAARGRWSDTADATVTYTVRVTVCDGCVASEPTVIPMVWADGRASTTAATDPAGYSPTKLYSLAEGAIEHAADEGDVALAFDDATGLPTEIHLTWDAADDGDYGFVINVTSVDHDT